MSDVAKTLSCCALLLVTMGAGCKQGGGGLGEPGVNNARKVQLYNCTHVNTATEPPSGRSFNIFTRVDSGTWVARGGLNPQLGPWTDCHDAAHEAASMTLDILDPAGKWEIRAIKLPRGDELSCDSSAPDVPGACTHLTYFFQTDVSASTFKVDVTDVGG